MTDGLRDKKNRGFTLVELISVLAIMMVVLGVAALSVSMMFSRDAQRAAVLIDDELTEARMLSMSKSGLITMIIHTKTDSSQNTIEIKQDSTTLKTVPIDTNVLISLKLAGTTVASAGSDIEIVFNKSNGSLEKIYGGAPAADGLYEIEAVAKRGQEKTAVVTLVANTGRHYTEK